MAAQFLRYGITSVRDTGGNLARLAALRERLEAGPEPAPRMFFAGPLLDGQFVVYDGGDPGRPPLGTDVSTPEAAERQVAELEAAGADFIKIYELVSPETFSALVEAARARGLPIAAHVPLSMVADQAGPQLDSMEHLRNVELACADGWRALLEQRQKRMAEFTEGRGYDLRASLHSAQRLPAIADYDAARCDEVLDALTGTTQVPTLRLNAFELARPFERADWESALDGLPHDLAADWRAAVAEYRTGQHDPRFAEWSLFLTGRMDQAGVPIGAGTDTPITYAVPGYSLHSELALLVRSGLTPMEALHAATIAPARFLGLQEQMGQVTPGQLADLVLLNADPLTDIENTRRIEGVMTDGRWLPAGGG
jgi:imidazolonepropionase-like amidohydrolase